MRRIDSGKLNKIKQARQDLITLVQDAINDYDDKDYDIEAIKELSQLFNTMQDFYYNLAKIARNRKPVWRPPSGKR